MPGSKSTGFDLVPTANGEVARLTCAQLRHAGIPLAPLLSQARLTSEQIDNDSIRLDSRSVIKLLELGAVAVNDDLLGFHLALDYDLREIGLFYYVLASSDTVAEGLRRAERYSRIVNEGIVPRFSASPETTITLSYVGVERAGHRHQIEFWLTSLVRFFRQLTNRQLRPNRIGMVHRREKTPTEMKLHFGCEIQFGAMADEVIFTEDVQTMPIVSADPYLNKLLVQFCEEALAHRDHSHPSLPSDLESEIARLLPHGRATATEVARRLGMSQRTLARRLSSEGRTFTAILDELKTDLAKSYLSEENLPISEIAWLLGYQEVSAFTHAFKRWTGVTPREFRALGAGVTTKPMSANT